MLGVASLWTCNLLRWGGNSVLVSFQKEVIGGSLAEDAKWIQELIDRFCRYSRGRSFHIHLKFLQLIAWVCSIRIFISRVDCEYAITTEFPIHNVFFYLHG